MLRALFPTLLLATALTACGGGSSVSPTPTPSVAHAPVESHSRIVPVAHEQGADIAYIGEDGGLWLIGADGSSARELYGSIQNGTRGYVYQPEWSPDGTKIAFTRVLFVIAPRKATYSEVSTLIIVDTGGTVLSETAGGFLPHWSPDGKRIVFLDEFDETPNAFAGRPSIMSVADGDVTNRLPVITTFDSPRWSPDGSMLAYSGADGLHVVDVDGLTDRPVLPNETGHARQFTFWSGERRVTAYEPARAQFYGCGDNCPIPGWGGEYVTVDIENNAAARVTNSACGRYPPDFVSHPQPLDGHAAWISRTSQIAVLPMCDTGFTVLDLIGLELPRRYPVEVTSLEWLDLSANGKQMLGSQRSRLGKFSHLERYPSPLYVIDMTTGLATQIAVDGRDATWRP